MPSDKHGPRPKTGSAIDALLNEERLYPPDPEFTRQANVRDSNVYAEAEKDPDAFWEKQASELDWFVRWNQVLEWIAPDAKWFVGGKLNASYNCLDRHVRGPRKNKAALIWEGSRATAGRSRTGISIAR